MASACPGRAAILAYLQGEFADGASDQVSWHLDHCSVCQSLGDELTAKSHWKRELGWFVSHPEADLGKSLTRRVSGSLATTEIDSVSDQLVAEDAENLPCSVTLSLTERFAKFEPVGVGGFATVFRAEDNVLGRIVALKMPHLPLSVLPEAGRRRFVTELRASAALHHPNIVPVFDAGLDERQCYLVSEFIPGPTLAEWLAEQTQPIEFTTAAELVGQLADAVQHAHDRHILHRDLKPSNILVDGTRASGRLPFTPRVTDFGLAQFYETDVSNTKDGTVLGSPPYMSPEQAQGHISQLGPATDVYALGVILYQLLTKQLPIKGSASAALLHAVIHEQPPPPKKYRPELPRDLEVICLTCLEKNPVRRYATTRDLAADLRRFIDGCPVTVRAPNVAERAWRWGQRYPAWASLVATVIVSFLTVVTLQARYGSAVARLNSELSGTNTKLVTANDNLKASLQQSLTATRRAEEEERRALEIVYAYDIRRAFEAYQKWDAPEVRAIVSHHADDAKRFDLCGLEWHWLNRQFHRESREVTRLPRAVYRMAIAPSVGRVSSLQVNDNQVENLPHEMRTLAVAGHDDVVRLVEMTTGRTLVEWPARQREVNGLAFSPDGKTLWTAGDDGTVAGWDVATRSETLRFEAHPDHLVFEVLYDAKRELLITCANEPIIRLWDARTGKPRGELAEHTETVEVIALHPDGRRLFSGSADDAILMWDLETLKSEVVGETMSGNVRCLAIAPNGRWLAAGTTSSQLLLWDLELKKVRVNWQVKDRIDRVCFDLSSERLFAMDDKGIAFEWPIPSASNWAEPLPPARIWSYQGIKPYDMQTTPDGSELLVASKDGGLRAFSPGLAASDYLALPVPRVVDFACLSDDRVAVIDEQGVSVINFSNARPESRVLQKSHGREWRLIEASPDGSLLAATTNDHDFGVWNLTTGERLATSVKALNGDGEFSFAPDNRWLAFVNNSGGRIEVLDLHSDQHRTFHVNSCRHVAFSPPGDFLAFDGLPPGLETPRQLRVVEWPSGNLRFAVPTNSTRPRLIAVSPNGRWLAITHDRMVRLYDTRTGRLVHELFGHQAEIRCVTFSPDSRTLATAGHDACVKLWHVSTGQFLLEFATAFGKPATRCHFAPDGRWLAYTTTSPSPISFIRLK